MTDVANVAVASVLRVRVRPEAWLAVLAFAGLCLAVFSVAPRLVEPDDYAYQASIIGITQGHLLTLTTAQAYALAQRLREPGLIQWVQLADGRWISQKDPGYPFLAVPFYWVPRLAPLFYGALGCLGLYLGGRRWLGRFGGTAAVALFCSSGAAMLFAWRDFMPTFTDASLIAAGAGALLWAVLAGSTWAGLAGFVALEAAVVVRYTDIVVLGCAVVAVLVAWRLGAMRGPALGWWLGSVAVFGAGLGVLDELVYGGPLRSGYPAGLITFGLGAVGPNLRYMPARLIETMPFLVLGLTAMAWIVVRAVRRRDSGTGRDLGVGLALFAAWLGIWALYSAYGWTAGPYLTNLQAVRFYVPALGPMALLGAWLVTRLRGRAVLAAGLGGAVALVLFGLGAWSYAGMTEVQVVHVGPGPQPGPGQPSFIQRG
jgi:hypothetical protein